MQVIDIPYVILKWDDRATIAYPPDPKDSIYNVSGDVLILDDTDEEKLVGKFEITYIDATRLIDCHQSIAEAMDVSDQCLGYFETLYDFNQYSFNEDVMSMFGDEVFSENLLILDRLELLPSYRGNGIGLVVMDLMIKRFVQGANLVALKAFPLQFEASIKPPNEWQKQMGLVDMSKSERAAKNKLMKHYGRLGFQRFKRTNYMLLNTAFIRPSIFVSG